MTSELKPDYEGFSLEICQIAFDGSDASGDTIQEIGLKHGVLREEQFNSKDHANVVNAEYFEEGQTVYCFAASRATPTADTLAGLVRYKFINDYVRTKNGFRKRRIVKQADHGEYVLYSKVAKIIAAKDAEIEKLKDGGHESFKSAVGWQERAKAAEAELRDLKHSIRIRSSSEELATVAMRDRLEIVAAELHDTRAELAQIKAQEPVWWAHNDGFVINLNLYEQTTEKHLYNPLYAAPVSDSLKAENERFRKLIMDCLKELDRSARPSYEWQLKARAALKGDSHDKG